MDRPPYRPGPDEDDLDTQPTTNRTQRLPPVPPMPPGTGHVRARDRRAKREQRDAERSAIPRATDEAMMAAERRARRRVTTHKDSGLFLPAWSVGLMLAVVFGVAALIVIVVLWLGGNNPPGGDPRVLIITAVPSETPAGGAQVVGQPTLAVGTPGTPGAFPTFALEGPLLPTVAMTPTQTRISVGATVRVINVGEARLNVRSGPGTTNSILFRAAEGDTFTVFGGPEVTENFTWWRLRSTTDPSQTGWAVENDGEQDVLEVAQ